MRFDRIMVTGLACAAVLSGCNAQPEDRTEPMIGLQWFAEYDDVKAQMDRYTLLEERENPEQRITQKMLDYTGVSLYDRGCDLTLCFTDSGLIGLNYHDVERHQGFRDWINTLEQTYGLPTEQGSGMASWSSNPLGKHTAI